MFRIGSKVQLVRTGEVGHVVSVSANTYTVALEDQRHVEAGHKFVQRQRTKTGPRIPWNTTPEELRLSRDLNLTVKQVRNARR